MAKRTPQRVLIIGGGYAGMIAAIRLAGRAKKRVSITLINGSERFVERVRQHEVAVNLPVKTYTIPKMLSGTGVNFVQGWVTAMHPEDNTITVKTDSGTQSHAYDYLFYAPGSRINQDAIPGLNEHAFVFNPQGDRATDALKQHLLDVAGTPQRVVVIGGGATGIEGATQIKAVYPEHDVTLLTRGEFGTFKGKRVAKHMRSAFAEQNVTIRDHAIAQSVEAGAVVLNDASRVPCDICVWSGGFVAPSLAKDAGLRVNHINQVLVDAQLRSLSHPNIFAIGDAGTPAEDIGTPFRMSLFFSLVMGAHAADTLNRILRGKTPKPLSFAWYGQGIALGLNDAVGFNTFPKDDPVGPIFRRKTGVFIREFFLKFIMWFFTLEKIIPGSLYWLGKGVMPASKNATAHRHRYNQHKREVLFPSPESLPTVVWRGQKKAPFLHDNGERAGG